MYHMAYINIFHYPIYSLIITLHIYTSIYTYIYIHTPFVQIHISNMFQYLLYIYIYRIILQLHVGTNTFTVSILSGYCICTYIYIYINIYRELYRCMFQSMVMVLQNIPCYWRIRSSRFKFCDMSSKIAHDIPY